MPKVISTSAWHMNDLYGAAGEIRPGQWTGVGAERLGLAGIVTREQFHALCENQNPETGDRLTQRQLNDDKRRVFYDFTCSAPKIPVSVLAVTLADERLVKRRMSGSHADCVPRTSKPSAATRVRKQGSQKDRGSPAISAAAAFLHNEQPRGARPAVAHTLHGVQCHV